MKLVVYTDGGGQSGEDVGGAAASAYVVQTEDGTYLGSRSKTITGTNNDAEFQGVVLALTDLVAGEVLSPDEIESVRFVSDSQLVVHHIRGDWKSKNERLRAHRDEARALAKLLPCPVTFTWQRREHNKNADRLVAAAMVDGGKTFFPSPIPSDPRTAQGRKQRA